MSKNLGYEQVYSTYNSSTNLNSDLEEFKKLVFRKVSTLETNGGHRLHKSLQRRLNFGDIISGIEGKVGLELSQLTIITITLRTIGSCLYSPSGSPDKKVIKA